MQDADVAMRHTFDDLDDTSARPAHRAPITTRLTTLNALDAHLVARESLHIVVVQNGEWFVVTLDRDLVHTVMAAVEDTGHVVALNLAQSVATWRHFTQETLLSQQREHVIDIGTITAAEDAHLLRNL